MSVLTKQSQLGRRTSRRQVFCCQIDKRQGDLWSRWLLHPTSCLYLICNFEWNCSSVYWFHNQVSHYWDEIPKWPVCQSSFWIEIVWFRPALNKACSRSDDSIWDHQLTGFSTSEWYASILLLFQFCIWKITAVPPFVGSLAQDNPRMRVTN